MSGHEIQRSIVETVSGAASVQARAPARREYVQAPVVFMEQQTKNFFTNTCLKHVIFILLPQLYA